MCILNFLNENTKGLGTLMSIISAFASGFFALWVYWQKAKLEKEFEKYRCQLQVDLEKEVGRYKQELQTEFLKVEFRIKKLSIIYPELFEKFKVAEGRISVICSKTEAKEAIDAAEIKATASLITEAIAFMVRNLLFISKEVTGCSDELMREMNKFENVTDPVKAKSYMQNLREMTDRLQCQMQKELESGN